MKAWDASNAIAWYRAQEYRDARARVLAQLDPLAARRSKGEFLPPSQFARMRALQAALRTSHAARDHKARMRTLNTAIE